MRHLGRLAPALPSALILMCVAARPAWAIALNWRLAVSGGASVPSNWSPSQLPTAADTLKFNVGGTYTVTFPGTTATSLSHLYRTGTVTLSTTGHTVSSILRVGDASGDVGTMTLTTGTLTTGGQITIGNNAGSTGTINVNDDDADLVQSGTTADIVVGLLGNGTLNVTGGGLVDAAESIVAGSGTGHIGTVLVSGVNASPLVRSTISSSGLTGDLTFGSSGIANVTIAAGGLASASDDVRIAVNSGSQANVTVEGFTGASASQLTVADDLDLARNDFGSAGGTGALLVQSSGSVIVGGTTRVGDPDGGTGTLRVRPAGRFTSHDLIFDNTHGVFDFQGGTVVVDSGTFDPPGTTLVLDHAQFESLQLLNGASATFDGGSPAGYAIILGETEEAGLRLENGAHVDLTNGVIAAALAPGSVGVLDLYTGAYLNGTGTLVIGQGGFGELNIGGGAEIGLTKMNVAFSPGSNGFVSIGGEGSNVELDMLEIGGQGITAGGTGYVEVMSGADMFLDGTGGVQLRLVHAGSTLRIGAGSSVTGTSNFDTRGHLALQGGTLTIGSMNFLDNADLIGYGTVDAAIAASLAPNSVIHATGGPLVLGRSSSDKGFSSAGTLICAPSSPVTIRDLDQAILGNVVLNSGNLTLPTAGGSLSSGKTLSGLGTINGNLLNLGNVSPGNSMGVVTVNGNYTQGVSAKMTMEIGDAATLLFDRMNLTGTASLAGTLDVRILPGHVPSPGETFTILHGASRVGSFSTVTIEGQPAGSQITMQYTATGVVVRVNAITTDVPLPTLDLPREIALLGQSGPWASAGFELALPEASNVVVRVYDAAGRQVGTLVDGDLPAGVVRLPLRELDARVGGGVYFGRATIRGREGEAVRTAKVTLVH